MTFISDICFEVQQRSFTKSSEKELIQQSISILSEYISDSYVSKLREIYKCDEIGKSTLSEVQKAELANANAPQNLMNSKVNTMKNEGSVTTPKAPKQTSREKALHDTKDKLKLKSITSFFSPAPKKS